MGPVEHMVLTFVTDNGPTNVEAITEHLRGIPIARGFCAWATVARECVNELVDKGKIRSVSTGVYEAI